jgi:hypothetical protein
MLFVVLGTVVMGACGSDPARSQYPRAPKNVAEFAGRYPGSCIVEGDGAGSVRQSFSFQTGSDRVVNGGIRVEPEGERPIKHGSDRVVNGGIRVEPEGERPIKHGSDQVVNGGIGVEPEGERPIRPGDTESDGFFVNEVERFDSNDCSGSAPADASKYPFRIRETVTFDDGTTGVVIESGEAGSGDTSLLQLVSNTAIRRGIFETPDGESSAQPLWDADETKAAG